MKKNTIFTLMTFLMLLFPFGAGAVNFEEFDTVAGIGETIIVDKLEKLERQVVTFRFACKGGTFERQSDVDGGDAEVVLLSEEVEKAGICTVKVVNSRNEEIASGSFEIFPDVPIRSELLQVHSSEDMEIGRETELKAGYFDRYGNPTTGRLVLVSGDGDVTRGAEDSSGYLHFLFTPDRAGMVELTLIDTFTEESHPFAFEVIDPSPPPAAPAAQNQSQGDAVTLLLGQLIRASLLSEYNSGSQNPSEATQGDYGLVDSFEVEVGDGTSTIQANSQEDLLITALDRRGRTVQNYVDRVSIEVSDPDAIVPGGLIRFKATDRGRKLLPLSVVFQTPGEQTITVRDESDPSQIFGMTKVWVLGQTSTPTNRSIVIHEGAGISANRRVTLSGTAPAYTNLSLILVDQEGVEEEIAKTSSGEDGTFLFQVTLPGEESEYTLFVRDPEDRVKDSDRIIVTVDATMPTLRTPLLTPATVQGGAPFTVSIEAESGQKVFAELPGVPRAELLRKSAGSEAGFDLYEGKLVAPATPNQYLVTVIVKDSAGNEAKETATLVVEASTVGPAIIQGLRAVTENQEVVLSWTPVAAAAGYRVYFGPSAEDLDRFVDTKVPSSGIRLTGLTAGETFFAVTALDSSGNESAGKSAVVSARMRGSLFELQAMGMVNGAKLEWVAPPGISIERYQVRYGIEPKAPTEMRWIARESTSVLLPDLINGIPYFLSIGAVQADGSLLQDTVEVIVIPGENGMPGMRLSPLDPLPPGIGGPGVTQGTKGTPTHSVAPTHGVPQTGPSLFILGFATFGFISLITSFRFFRTRKLERALLSLHV
ncbi:MAG TPA: hypothetical protein VJB60_02525 [Candidatus Peribacterales bacterium]|nr:hypothetical protein [Candidatus Peribacterales bacterium]